MAMPADQSSWTQAVILAAVFLDLFGVGLVVPNLVFRWKEVGITPAGRGPSMSGAAAAPGGAAPGATPGVGASTFSTPRSVENNPRMLSSNCREFITFDLINVLKLTDESSSFSASKVDFRLFMTASDLTPSKRASETNQMKKARTKR